MSSPSPCGYCGATSEITHSGNTNTPMIITATISIAITDGVEGLVFMSDASVPAPCRPGSVPRVCLCGVMRYLLDESWTFEFLPDTRIRPDISWWSAEQKSVQ